MRIGIITFSVGCALLPFVVNTAQAFSVSIADRTTSCSQAGATASLVLPAVLATRCLVGMGEGTPRPSASVSHWLGARAQLRRVEAARARHGH
eukprot:3185476-Pyramimonas_sp.AAC.3